MICSFRPHYDRVRVPRSRSWPCADHFAPTLRPPAPRVRWPNAHAVGLYLGLPSAVREPGGLPSEFSLACVSYGCQGGGGGYDDSPLFSATG